ncbi:Single-stranded DNA-binding protein, partial [Waddlia chondrophila 2032/99]
EGRLQLDVWEGKEGDKRCKLRVAAERVQFLEKLDRKNSQEENDALAESYVLN